MEATAEITAAVKNVPALRFPEFYGEWVNVKLGSLAKTITSGSRDWAQFYSDSGDKFIRMTNLPKKGISLILDDLRFVSLPENSSEGKRTSLEFGDILISITAELGKIGWIPSDLGLAYINQHVALVRLSKKVDSQFIAHHLSTNKSNVRLNRLNDSGAKAGLNLLSIRSLSLTIPTIGEQQKIASFLTIVDDQIQQLSKKKSLLDKYKKGVMQQIFSQQIRFKDDNGNNFPVWEEKKLGEVFERVKSKNAENNKNVLTISAQHGLINQEDFFNKSVSAENVTGYYLLQKGDFAYNKSYSKGYPMGAIKRLTKYDKGVVSTLYICFKIKDGSSEEYFEQYFNSGNLNSELHKIAQEGARNHGLLNMSVVEFFNDIKLPRPTIAEQTKIASFLTSIDNKINYTSKQLGQAQQFKKGLLQQLFV
ncbi:type I restriction enzyme S subunit [Pontibacter aydingkolensis]|uniref:Restriction endonuclease subunit S n=1 Tax=Pontibacter aydingkolensis TaxID=1911536 RepID=A0ABS7CSL6_9BACT|nr:restriction endonuclease subunit S [Pontibacter aydingkolensis]MBW7466836.1 restriction endonuclease subunit S [Pontibacter aydingkolensis]